MLRLQQAYEVLYKKANIVLTCCKDLVDVNITIQYTKLPALTNSYFTKK